MKTVFASAEVAPGHKARILEWAPQLCVKLQRIVIHGATKTELRIGTDRFVILSPEILLALDARVAPGCLIRVDATNGSETRSPIRVVLAYEEER